MRLAHLADLHLGALRYHRFLPSGVNVREADVYDAFRRMVAAVIAERPDVVVIAGDLFERAVPNTAARLVASTGVKEMVTAGLVVVIVSGNHDAPRTSYSVNPLALLEQHGAHVVDRAAERLAFPALGLSILCVPDVPGMVRPALVPDPAARYNLLLLHGEISGVIPGATSVAGAPGVYDASEIEGAWDYVALGHFHVAAQIGPRAWYAGSLEYTSTNPWGELAREAELGIPGKGFIVHDLATQAHSFHPVATRPHLDLPPIDAAGLSPESVTEAIVASCTAVPGGIADKVVRLTVRDIARSVQHELDHKAIRKLKAAALQLQLELRRPADGFTAGGSGAIAQDDGEDIFDAFAREDAAPPAGCDDAYYTPEDAAWAAAGGAALLRTGALLPDPYQVTV